MVSLAFAQRKRCPCSQRKIILIIDRHRFTVVVCFFSMRFRFLPESDQPTCRTVHYQLTRLHIQVNLCDFTFGIHQVETCYTRCVRSYIHFQFVCTVCLRNNLINLIFVFHRNRVERTGIFAQRFHFLHHVGSYINLTVLGVQRQFTRQSVGTPILADWGHIGVLPVAHPRNRDDTFARIRNADRRIMVFSIIQPLYGFRFRITCKFFPVEISYKIFRCASAEHTSRIDIDQHHPFHLVFVPVYRQLDEIGTFELVGLCTVTFAESTHIFPVLQIL